MISKDEFFQMTEDEIIEYVEKHYFIDDVNEVCDDYVLEVCEYEEDEYESILEDCQPFQYVLETMKGNNLKEYLWESVINECEELDLDEEVEDD